MDNGAFSYSKLQNEFLNRIGIPTFDLQASVWETAFYFCSLAYYCKSVITKNYLNEVIHAAEGIGRQKRSEVKRVNESCSVCPLATGSWTTQLLARDPCHRLGLSNQNDFEIHRDVRIKVLELLSAQNYKGLRDMATIELISEAF